MPHCVVAAQQNRVARLSKQLIEALSAVGAEQGDAVLALLHAAGLVAGVTVRNSEDSVEQAAAFLQALVVVEQSIRVEVQPARTGTVAVSLSPLVH